MEDKVKKYQYNGFGNFQIAKFDTSDTGEFQKRVLYPKRLNILRQI